MTDIVTRLRTGQTEGSYLRWHVTSVHVEAADEIERLRRGGCARDQTTTQFCAEANRLAIENERLRAALREIQALTGRTDIKWPDKKAAIRRLVTEALGDD